MAECQNDPAVVQGDPYPSACPKPPDPPYSWCVWSIVKHPAALCFDHHIRSNSRARPVCHPGAGRVPCWRFTDRTLTLCNPSKSIVSIGPTHMHNFGRHVSSPRPFSEARRGVVDQILRLFDLVGIKQTDGRIQAFQGYRIVSTLPKVPFKGGNNPPAEVWRFPSCCQHLVARRRPAGHQRGYKGRTERRTF